MAGRRVGLWLILLMGRSATSLAAQAGLLPPKESVVSRFLRYVRIDTQSKEDQGTSPSTAKQLDLARLLAQELTALGAESVRVSEFGIVSARIPGRPAANQSLPGVGLICHLDTAPNLSGAGVNPQVHRNYQGGDLVLPGDTSQVIRVSENPDLATMIGDDIITTDGTTLLGSDDKAGCAEIITLVDLLRENPDIAHGPIAIAGMPDEEVGGAVAHFDVAGFGARYAYTVDGGGLGGINDETFSARTAYLTFKGRDGAPIKGRLVNTAYAVADLVARVPAELRPENVEGRQGYLHPYTAEVAVGESSLKFRMRAFRTEELDQQAALLRRLIAETERRFPKVTITLEIKEFFKNMKDSLDRHPELIANAVEATRRAGLTPRLSPIRGGTDGSNLTNRGLPTPDLFTGGHNFHTRLEFNSRRGLEKTVEMLVHLVQVFAERPR